MFTHQEMLGVEFKGWGPGHPGFSLLQSLDPTLKDSPSNDNPERTESCAIHFVIPQLVTFVKHKVFHSNSVIAFPQQINKWNKIKNNWLTCSECIKLAPSWLDSTFCTDVTNGHHLFLVVLTPDPFGYFYCPWNKWPSGCPWQCLTRWLPFS